MCRSRTELKDFCDAYVTDKEINKMKMNKKVDPLARVEKNPNKKRNLAGGVAYAVPEKLELYKKTMAWLVNEPRFYGSERKHNADVIRLINSISEADPEFVLKLATYARNEMYLRSAPLYMLVAALKSPQARKHVRKYVPQIVKRADEIPESVALYKHFNNKVGSMPNQFRKGMQDTYHNFGAYHFGKYRANDKDISQVDAIRIYHPIAKDLEQGELFRQIRHNEVPTPDTWETIISVEGSNKESWTKASKVMPYMAKLRNLRNFAKHGVDLTEVLAHLTNPKAVANSRQFPFRFYSAKKVFDTSSVDPFVRNDIMKALDAALQLSVSNLPNVGGRTAIFNDVSGSMSSPVSNMSNMNRNEVAGLMAAMAYGFSDNAMTGKFGQVFKTMALNPSDSVLTNASRMMANDGCGHSTNGHLAIDHLIKNKVKVDRIMVFTDEQLWNSGRYGGGYLAKSLVNYKRMVNPNVILYVFDLASHGDSLVPASEANVVQASGFSDKVFKYIQMYEKGDGLVLNEIENYHISY